MKGIFSALICSFDENGKVNEKGLREIIRYNLDVNQVDGLYVNGSSGENFMLSTEEKKKVFEVAKDEVGSDAKLIAQIGSLDIDEAIDLGQYATELGYDAVSAVTPFYYPFGFEEVKDYYYTIMESVDNDLLIYSIPALTGVNMTLDQFGELFSHPKVIGVKFTAPDFYLLERLRSAYPDKLIYSGFDEMLLPASVMKIDGAIGSTFNVNGKRARQIFELAQKGELDKAYEIQQSTNDLITEILGNGLYQTLKELLKTQGVDAGYCKKPMRNLDAQGIEKAKAIAANHLN